MKVFISLKRKVMVHIYCLPMRWDITVEVTKNILIIITVLIVVV